MKGESKAHKFFMELYSSAEYNFKGILRPCTFNLNSYDGKTCGATFTTLQRLITHYSGHSGLKFSRNSAATHAASLLYELVLSRNIIKKQCTATKPGTH